MDRHFGIPRTHLEETDSTNTIARRMAADGAPGGTLVTADRQTAGRGRLDRTWLSDPAVNVLASYILRPLRDTGEWGGIPLLAGLAVVDAITRSTGRMPRLKWPNDILIDGRKVSGILTEAGRTEENCWCVVGIGINVNQIRFTGEYRLTPTSLALEAGRTLDVEEVIEALTASLERKYTLWEEGGTPAVAREWRTYGLTEGEWYRHDDGRTQRRIRPVDLRDDGSLSVETESGVREVLWSGDLLPDR